MSGTDDRVVSMQFDNARFQQNVEETLRDLDKLRTGLNFDQSTRGLDNLAAAGRNFNLGNIGGSIEGVSAKFMAMATIGITALANITTKAVDAGLNFVKSFTFAPINDGFHEFETNMNSIQTILANTKSKGSGLNDVNKALDELNTYSDKTIYNFTEMAHNIGTFTAAGVDLKTSTASIKGIANLAAISGSSSEQASTAMYQLSQAIASGTVKLMDWNSVVNAGMGGETFQKALFESGKAMKTLTDVPAGQTFDQWKKAGNSFRDSLQSGWLTTEVLTKTLSTFTGDLTEQQIQALGYTKQQAQELFTLGQTGLQAATQVKTFTQLVQTVKEAIGSGWTKSFQLLFGNFEQSVQLFTRISNAIGKFVGDSADARNKLLEGWNKAGGRNLLIESLASAIKNIGEIIKPVKEAFREFFPKKTSEDLLNMTKNFYNFTQRLKPAPETVDRLKRIFEGLFAVVDIIINVFLELKDLFGDLIGNFKGTGDGAFAFAAKMGDAAVKLDEFLVNGGNLHKFFKNLGDTIENLGGIAKDAVTSIINFFKSLGGGEGGDAARAAAEGGLDRIRQRFETLGGIAERIGNVFERIHNLISTVMDKITGILKKAWSYIGPWFKDLGKNISDSLGEGDFDSFLDALNIGLLGGIVVLLKKFLKNGFTISGELKGGFIDSMKTTFDQLTNTLKAMQAQLKAEALMKIAIAIGIITASIVALSMIDSANLTKALVAITVSFGELIGTMTAMDKVAGSSKDAAKISVLAGALIAVSTALVIFTGAVAIMSKLSWEDMSKGLLGIGTGLAIMVGATMLMSTDSSGLIAGSIAMTAMATALTILAGAVKLFSTMSWEEMAKGLGGIAVGLGLMVAAMLAMPGPLIIGAGLAMIPIATGLTILAGAVKLFSMMSWSDMAKGLAGVAGGLVAIAIGMNLMPLNMPITAAGLILVGVALTIIAKAVKMFGSMDIGELAKGIGAIAAVMVVLAMAMAAMTGALPGAAATLIASVALAALAKVIITLGQTDWQILALGIGAIAAALTVLALAALLMAPVVPAMFGLGAALLLIGGAFALFGVGAMAVAKAFELLAKAGKEGVQVLIDSIIMLIKAFPQMIAEMAKSLAEAADDILKAGGLVIKIAGVFLAQFLDTVIQLAPKITQALIVIITDFLLLIRTKIPDIVETGFTVLIAFLKGFRDHIQEIVTLAIDLLIKFTTTLTDNAGRIVTAAAKLIAAFLEEMAKHAGEVIAAGAELIAKMLEGFANNINKVIDAGAKLIISFLEGMAKNTLKVINAAADILINFLEGLAKSIRTHTPELEKAGLDIIGAIVDGMTGGIASKVGDVGGGLIDMGKKGLGGLMKWGKVHSPSKRFAEVGAFFALGFAQGIQNSSAPEDSIVDQAERVVRAFQETLRNIPSQLEGMDEMNPVITPVLDLTKVQNGARNLNNLIPNGEVTPGFSINQSHIISAQLEELARRLTADEDRATITEVKFEQVIHSPEALSTNDIYRQTRSQLALAKEELGIK